MTCSICGKNGADMGMTDHVEAKRVDDLLFSVGFLDEGEKSDLWDDGFSYHVSCLDGDNITKKIAYNWIISNVCGGDTDMINIVMGEPS